MKGWVGLVGWPTADGLPISGHPPAAGRAQDSERSLPTSLSDYEQSSNSITPDPTIALVRLLANAIM